MKAREMAAEARSFAAIRDAVDNTSDGVESG